MKSAMAVGALLLLLGAVAANQVESNPLGKVFQLMSELEAKIVKEGEAEAKAFKEFFEWCDEASQNINNQIKTAKENKEKLTAKIEELSSDIQVGNSKIEDLSAAIAGDEAELKDATTIRDKEHADFLVSEKELSDTVDPLD